MRRKDREVTDFDAMLSIVEACDIVRIGLADGAFPYVVPLNFAYAVKDGRLSLYVHGAPAGRKYELMRKNGVCSFEMDVPVRIECLPETGSVTMRYRCVMGTARIAFLEGEEKQRVIDEILLARWEQTRGFSYNRASVKGTAVARLDVLTWSAKANPPLGSAGTV